MAIRTGPVHQRPVSSAVSQATTRPQQPATAAQLSRALLGDMKGMPTVLGSTASLLSPTFLAAFGAALRGGRPGQSANTPRNTAAPAPTPEQVRADTLQRMAADLEKLRAPRGNPSTPEQVRAENLQRMAADLQKLGARGRQAELNDLIDRANAMTPEQARAASTMTRAQMSETRSASAPRASAQRELQFEFERLPDGRAMIDALPGSNLNEVRKQAQTLANTLREPVCFLGNDGFESVNPG